MKKLTAVVLTALTLSVVPMAQLGASGLTDADAVANQVSAHIGSYLGGHQHGNAGAAIGGAIGAVAGLAVGAYVGSSMGPGGMVILGMRGASIARNLGTIVGGA